MAFAACTLRQQSHEYRGHPYFKYRCTHLHRFAGFGQRIHRHTRTHTHTHAHTHTTPTHRKRVVSPLKSDQRLAAPWQARTSTYQLETNSTRAHRRLTASPSVSRSEVDDSPGSHSKADSAPVQIRATCTRGAARFLRRLTLRRFFGGIFIYSGALRGIAERGARAPRAAPFRCRACS